MARILSDTTADLSGDASGLRQELLFFRTEEGERQGTASSQMVKPTREYLPPPAAPKPARATVLKQVAPKPPKPAVAAGAVPKQPSRGASVKLEDTKPLIVWDDSIATGIEHIDEQHKELINLVNRLNGAMQQGQGKAVLGEILDELGHYAVFHFKQEEDLFDKYGYPETEQHKAVHEKLLNDTTAFIEQFKSGQAGMSHDLFFFLKDWLTHHIKGVDHRYVPFLREAMENDT
jgi:methyl-accepting chemotaxis protein